MGQIISLDKALENEFSCYYHGDELPPVRSDVFLTTLPQRTSASSLRLRRAIGDERVLDLIDLLKSLKDDPCGATMSVITNATLVGWADDPQSWAVFQSLIEQLIEALRSGPSPHPK